MSMLGAVLAGGRSSRFGTDKAEATFAGQSLLAHAVGWLRARCDDVVIVGRPSELAVSVADWPRPDMGPLGGFAGAFDHALKQGHAEVLTLGVDSIDLPDDLPVRLCPAPAFVASQPIIGRWPTQAIRTLEDILSGSGKHSMMRFVDSIGARAVHLDRLPANINTPDDLARLESVHGL